MLFKYMLTAMLHLYKTFLPLILPFPHSTNINIWVEHISEVQFWFIQYDLQAFVTYHYVGFLIRVLIKKKYQIEKFVLCLLLNLVLKTMSNILLVNVHYLKTYFLNSSQNRRNVLFFNFPDAVLYIVSSLDLRTNFLFYILCSIAVVFF